jgi:hypothetical protein
MGPTPRQEFEAGTMEGLRAPKERSKASREFCVAIISRQVQEN